MLIVSLVLIVVIILFFVYQIHQDKKIDRITKKNKLFANVKFKIKYFQLCYVVIIIKKFLREKKSKKRVVVFFAPVEEKGEEAVRWFVDNVR